MPDIRILLVEHSLEEARFLEEALDEIQESARQGPWMAFRVTQVSEIDDACAVAAAGDCDLVLLDPSQHGMSAPGAFAAIRDAAPELPLVLIIDRADEPLARRMLREGAQDYLTKDEVDCAPLARAIRNAIERQRYLMSFRRGSAFDALTGFYNMPGFIMAAGRELHLAAGAGQPLLLVRAEVDNLNEITAAYGREQRELTLLEAVEVLRESAGPSALLGCMEGGSFAVVVWNMRPDDFIGRVQAQLATQARPFAFAFGWTVTHPGAVESIDPLLTAAEASLCENKQSYQVFAETSLSMPPTVPVGTCPV
jgi:PleD family two-component response regulator